VGGGPEAATAFLAIAAAATCAPLNPSYRAAELDFYLRDLGARAVVVDAALDTPARDVAGAIGIEVHELSVESHERAGVFALVGLEPATGIDPPPGDAEALLLHTSGTTARPKIVPLMHRHLLVSARNVATTLELGSRDRCLNVMPLFHIHGLVAGVLASLWSGGSVACAPGFHQVRYFEWLTELEPTWTTAVPTMHQAILERVRRDPSVLGDHTLRFLRSSSSALPVPVLEGLEAAFGVPVIEAYGMTEAAHQMSSNPLPPGLRKPGSVGLPTGIEVTVLDEAGGRLPPDVVGEVAVRGESVFGGYEANPEANSAAFVDGWFRTGDQGRLDEDGYLFLHGRLKELINRAGEKIAPLEVDEVLLRHPAVEQAVTFGVPHERLGEEVAAAVVPRAGAVVDAADIQDFVAQVVAPFKVPRRILVVDEIPKAATGKVQRVSLAERLDVKQVDVDTGGRAADAFLVESIRTVWADVLGIPVVDESDDFFALGGDSILGTEAVARIRALVDRPDLPLVAIVRSPTPRAMALEVERHLAWGAQAIVPLGGEKHASPMFFVHGVDGDVVRFVPMARLLSDRAVFGLRAPGFEPDTQPPSDIEGLAATYLPELRAVQEEGPYVIASYCMGAELALELAHLLEAEGQAAQLVLIDPRLRRPSGLRYVLWLLPRRLRQRRFVLAVRRRLGRSTPIQGHPDDERGPVWAALEHAREQYVGRRTAAPAVVLRAEDFERFEMPDWYIRSLFGQVLATEQLPGEHVDLFRPPALASLHEAVMRALARFEA
jgi:acyl-CoA synthetase (AMP-forming)/AMP-acid ligase II/thioesterase domain-containing protein